MDPNGDLLLLDKKLAWGSDPGYPLTVTYDKMATGLKTVEAKIGKHRCSAGDRSSDKKSRFEARTQAGEGSSHSEEGGLLPVRHPTWQREGGCRREGEGLVGEEVL
jgi:hypothetical protein